MAGLILGFGHRIERNRDNQVRAPRDGFGNLAPLGLANFIAFWFVRCDHPHVANVVSIAGALRVRSVTARREQPVLIQRAHELHVIVAEGRRVFLQRPFHADDPQVQVVGRPGLAIESVVDADCFELLQLLREHVAAHAGHARGRVHLEAIDAVVDDQRRRHGRPSHRHVARSDERVGRDVHFQRDLVRPGAHDARHGDALTEPDVLHSRRGRQIRPEDLDRHRG